MGKNQIEHFEWNEITYVTAAVSYEEFDLH